MAPKSRTPVDVAKRREMMGRLIETDLASNLFLYCIIRGGRMVELTRIELATS